MNLMKNMRHQQRLPGAAMEFDLNKIGKVISNELDITNRIINNQI